MNMHAITFDSTSPNWSKDMVENNYFLRYTEVNINRILKARGYIYLNQIHEMLGVKWNPIIENPCIVYNKPTTEIYINKTYLTDGSCKLLIFWYD